MQCEQILFLQPESTQTQELATLPGSHTQLRRFERITCADLLRNPISAEHKPPNYFTEALYYGDSLMDVLDGWM